MKLRNKLFKAYKRTGNHYKLSQYKLARNCITKEVRKAKKRFLESTRHLQSKNLLEIVQGKKKSSIPTLLAPDSSLVTDNKEKASILNTVFASNFNHSYSTLNPDQRDYSIPPRAEFPEALFCTEEQVSNSHPHSTCQNLWVLTVSLPEC